MTEQATNNSNINILVKIYTDPVEAFKAIKNSPSWIFPIILTLLFSFVFMYSTTDIQKEIQRKSILESERIPENVKDQALENLDKPSFFREKIMPSITSVVITFIVPLMIALVFFVFGNFIFGGKSTFKLNFAAVCWAGMIGLLEMIIKLPLILYKGTMEVYTSLALFMDVSQSKTFVFSMLNMFDVFSIWKIVVYASAFMVIYNFSKQKSYATILSLFIVMSLIGFGFSQLFS